MNQVIKLSVRKSGVFFFFSCLIRTLYEKLIPQTSVVICPLGPSDSAVGFARTIRLLKPNCPEPFMWQALC